MKQPPLRTRETSLTDDELLLFDAIFNCAWPFGALRRREYGFHLSTHGYTHRLEDDALESCLESLAARGLIERYGVAMNDRQVACIKLTSEGGRYWEAERRPDWLRYCSDECPDDGILSIVAYHPDVAWNDLEEHIRVGSFVCDEGPVEFRRFIPGIDAPAWSVVSWRGATPAFRLTVRGHHCWHDSPLPIHINWWRSIAELGELNAALGGFPVSCDEDRFPMPDITR